SNTGVFTSSAAGDKWGLRAIQTMLNALPPDPAIDPKLAPLETKGAQNQATTEAIERFQKSRGLGQSGQANAPTRNALFLAYMDVLCFDGQGKPYQLDPKENFLGKNADLLGKGDFQGCSEFNPVLIFSKADQKRFASDKDKSSRNLANIPNR